MPADPHQWQTGDIVSASLLDGDLYLSQGQMFAPNGIRFHARRPLYKSYNANSGNSLTSGSWGNTYGASGNTVTNGAANVIVDTPGLLAAWFDPNQKGSFNLFNLTGAGGSMGGGGLAPSNGGIMLAATYCLWGQTANTSNLGCGIGDSTATTSAPASWGTLQPTNSAHQTCCFALDLVDAAALRYANFAFNGTNGALSPVSTVQADGSGWASRSMAFWASVYSTFSNPPASAPAPLANWTGQTITAPLLNGSTGIRQMLRQLNSPPMLRATQTSSQSLTGGTPATATNMAATSGFNSWGTFSSNTFTAPQSGLYLFHGYAACGNIAAPFRVGVQVNGGANIWGPWTPAVATSGNMTGTKTQILSLNAGDTVVMRLEANANTSTIGSGSVARMILLWLGAQATPTPTNTPPDTTFRWAAGTAGPVNGLFNSHIANDLGFLNQKPYMLAYQTVAQSISMSTPTVVSMDTVQGQIHGDGGDPWGGYSSIGGLYKAPIAGWYLAVTEVTLVTPTLTATPSVIAGFNLQPSGTDPYDRYQQQNLPSTAGGGATAVGLYYLRVNDTIGPAIETFDSSATAINTSTSVNSHFELVWLGEG